MAGLEETLKEIARSAGADLAGIAGPERLSGPPSLDPTFVLPGARSVVSLAGAMDAGAIEKYLAKENRWAHCVDHFEAHRRVQEAAERVAERLRQEGHRAVSVPLNLVYRIGGTARYPDFSHRYAAVAAGVGTLGRSGNVMVPRHGACVALGSVVTDAELASDPLPDENLCDDCKLCLASCLSRYMKKETAPVTAAGRTFEVSQKRSGVRCNMTCGGLNGRGQMERRFSTWCPDEVNVEGDPRVRSLRNLFALLKDLPEVEGRLAAAVPVQENRLSSRDRYSFTMSCSHCMLVCAADKKERQRRFKILRDSGVVERGADGSLKVVMNGDTVRAFPPGYERRGAYRASLRDRLAMARYAFLSPATGRLLHRPRRAALRSLLESIEERVL